MKVMAELECCELEAVGGGDGSKPPGLHLEQPMHESESGQLMIVSSSRSCRAAYSPQGRAFPVFAESKSHSGVTMAFAFCK